MIVGTAGHVDHGKTSLVRALTGIDTDRLAEEKARGITIDLGFAYLPMAEGAPIGFVDVPGHERLVRTMVAGASGIDFAMLVVAADDGVMPQTREHLDILDLLGLRRGLVVVTKRDRVDEARIAAVRAEIAVAVAGTFLEHAEVLAVSAATGEGIEGLHDRLVAEASVAALHRAGGLFRMPVDRAFTLPGVGTVATGTAVSGRVSVGEEVLVLPAGRRARIRSLHAQSRDARDGEGGARLALALAGPGIGREMVGRGAWICAADSPGSTVRFDAELRLLRGEARLRDNMPVHLHCGASDVLARLVPLEGMGSAQAAFAQVVLEAPLPLRHGDLFVLRDQSATRTIGGGRVIDPRAPHRRRRSAERMAHLVAARPAEPSEALANLLEWPPGLIDLDAFRDDRNMLSSEAGALCEALSLDADRHAAGTIVGRPARWVELREHTATILAAFHAENPELPGLTGERLRLALALPKPMFAAVRDRLLADKRCVRQGHWLRLPGHVAELASEDRHVSDLAMPLIAADRFRPPRVRDIAEAIGIDEAAVRRACRALARTGDVLEIARDHYFTRATVAEMAGIAADLTHGAGSGRFTAADFRDRLDNGRKVAIQILDYFDRHGLTRRDGDLRRVVKAPDLVFGPTSAPP